MYDLKLLVATLDGVVGVQSPHTAASLTHAFGELRKSEKDYVALLTLAADMICWRQTHCYLRLATVGTEEPVKRSGIRYWPEKGGDPIVKWLPDCAVPLAKRAIEGFTRLCQKAREAAQVLERNPDLVPLPGGFDPDRPLSMNEMGKVLGLPRRTSLQRFLKRSLNLLPAKRVGLRKAGHPSALYRVRDVEA